MLNMVSRITGVLNYLKLHTGLAPGSAYAKLWGEFSKNSHFIPGNGMHIKFWKDKWLSRCKLKDDFLTRFGSLGIHTLSSLKTEKETLGKLLSREPYMTGIRRTPQPSL